MPYATTPLSPAVREAVARAWRLGADGRERAERLHGGEESAAYRLGDVVVRIGPRWRSSEVAEWCHAVARHARAGGLAEALAPLPTGTGETVVRVGGRPVSVWPYAEGAWPDRDDPAQRSAAARLLGQLHRALLAAPRLAPRPVPGELEEGLHGAGWTALPSLADPALDRWLAKFRARAPLVHALHGDYYRGNLLAGNGGRTPTAVLDWDEALVGPPALEAATAAREFTDPWATDLSGALAFTRTYAEAGGTAGALTEEELAQFVRHRLRCEAAAYERERARGAVPDAEDVAYHERRVELYGKLRP